MSGIYIHIPFCKQACHYCDFHFSTSMQKKGDLLAALQKELLIRKEEFNPISIESVYFGGGTPSLLTQKEIATLLQTISRHYNLNPLAEITLEANPDDLSETYVKELALSGVNRLSIGIQSFNDQALKFMNRAHNAYEARQSLEWVSQSFSNFSLDLIYGVPNETPLQTDFTASKAAEVWKSDVEIAQSFNPPHISSYALTVEPKTILYHQINTGKLPALSEQKAADEFAYLKQALVGAGYEHYEFSNFSKPGFHAVNNSGYWKGSSYLGIGPSAHSYHKGIRSWNISNNAAYTKSISIGVLPSTQEVLSVADQYNEFVMTALRTASGVSTEKILTLFGASFKEYLITEAQEEIKKGNLILDSSGVLSVASKAQFFTDGLAAQLFYI